MNPQGLAIDGWFEIDPRQLPAPGARTLIAAAGRSIALFNVEGTMYAIDDSCPHQGSSLCAGTLSGRLVQCRAHGLRFDLRTGCMPGAAGFGVRTYALRDDGDRVSIQLPEGDPVNPAS